MAVNDVSQSAYKAKDVSKPLPEYDAMRARLAQRSNADVGQQQDAMQRRFASQGGLNSGAAIKQQQLVAEAGAQNREQAMEGVNSQESAERRRLQEAESQKEFQSQEAATGRQFQSKEAQVGRDFAAGESRLGRESQRSMFDVDMGFKEKVQSWSETNEGKKLDLAYKQFGLAEHESAINQAIAAAGMDDDQREWLGYAQGGNFDLAAAREGIAARKAQREREKQGGSVAGAGIGASVGSAFGPLGSAVGGWLGW